MTMKLKPELSQDSDEEEDIQFFKKSKKPKRIIQDSDSETSDSSDEEDNLPLHKRFKQNEHSPVAEKFRALNLQNTPPPSRKLFELTDRPKSKSSANPSNPIQPPEIKEPRIVVSRFGQAPSSFRKTLLNFEKRSIVVQPLKPNESADNITLTNKPTKSENPIKVESTPLSGHRTKSSLVNSKFKAPLPVSKAGFKASLPASNHDPKPTSPVLKSPESKAPLPESNTQFKAPLSTSNNEFKAPLPVSNNEFKAPLPVSNNEFKAPLPVSNNEFKAPLPVSNNEFKAPLAVSNDEFKAPLSIIKDTQQVASISSRLIHYMQSICEDLDQYNQTKHKPADSLLVFKENEDLPMLDINVMRKFSSLTTDTLKNHKSLESVDLDQFGKVIKLMENTIILATDLEPIDHYGKDPTERRSSTFDMLKLITEALEASCMIFDILTTCKLDKKFLSRNLINNCLHFIKNQLDYTIYPLIDISGFESESNLLTSNAHAFHSLIMTSPTEKQWVSNFIPTIVRFFRRAFTLILSEELDDDVLVIVAYISMAPFFHDYPESGTSILLDIRDPKAFNPYEQLKFYALDILKHIFSSYPKHRRWIFEEILTSLGSLTTMDGTKRYRLRENKSIHVISALFMQLVQCCSSVSDRSSHLNWFKKWHIKHQKVASRTDPDQIRQLEDKLVERAAEVWRVSTEAAANSASFFLEFLMAKCKSKKTDAYSLSEYRQILDQTLGDIMTVFHDPEWPVAELIMRVFSRILLSLLQEDRSDQYLKSLAIEWLGILCCKIKSGYERLTGPEWVYGLHEALPMRVDRETPLDQIDRLDQCRKRLLDYVMEEKMSPSIVQMYLCQWGFIESVVWTKANKGWEIKEKKVKAGQEDTTMMEDVVMEEGEEETKWPKEVVDWLRECCKYYWMSCLKLDCQFPISERPVEFPEMSRSDYGLLVELLASRQTLYTSFNFILSELLTCLEKDAVLYRTKALKAIGKIAIEVPDIMEDQRIRTAVIQRVHDSSPSVRDAAVDVLAKYLGRLSSVPKNLYDIVSGRIMDTAVNVRKRLVKLLRDLYFKFSDIEIKTDIASKLILRIGDNEISINQLSLKSTQEILFLPFKQLEKDESDYFGYSYANSPKSRKKKITDLTSIITGAVSKLDSSIKGQNATLSKIIQKTVEGADEKSALWYNKVFQWIVDSLFDRMMTLEEEDNTTEFINCLATVYSFTKSCPNLLRESHISMLQPYLTIAEDADWTKAHYVLSIYRDVLPYMKTHDLGFIQSIERLLMQLLGRCPLNLIEDGISCLCVIVDTISHRYNILIKMLGSCVTKLRQVQTVITNGQDAGGKVYAGVLKMILMCGLLCQNFEFDKKREEEPEEMMALNLVYKGQIDILVFEILKFFTSDTIEELGEEGIQMQMVALQGLGYFFSSYPTFMISPESTRLMDKIFESGSIELKVRLMLVFQEFLSAEEKRIGKREAGEPLTTIDLDTLLGNTAEYAELGVNGSLMQRYLRKILKCALSESSDLRYAAFEVVSSIVHQGLAHPVLCMSAIVAAETSSDVILRSKAYYLHRYAHDKYGNLLYIQMNEYLSTSYQYQKIVCGADQVKGFGKRGGDAKVDPLLGVTYSILKEKKKPKSDFLIGLVKPFEFDLKTTTSDDIDIDYLRYLSENIIHLTLSTTDDVLSMVHVMDRILMTLGTDLLSYVHFLKKQGIVKADNTSFVENPVEDEKEMDSDFIVSSKLAIAMCILLYVKNLLVELYDIPDDEIRDYNPNVKHKARDVTVDPEIEIKIPLDELLYFKDRRLTKQSASDACIRFEYLIMNDTTAIVNEDQEE